MWLPKDERRLLAGYYHELGQEGVGPSRVYRASAWYECLDGHTPKEHVPEYGEVIPEQERGPTTPASMRRFARMLNRVRVANEHLSKRGLISLQRHESESQVFVVGLTLEGYDLGRQYSRFLTRSGLLFREYKDHWLWLIAACIGGALVTIALNLLLAWLTQHPGAVSTAAPPSSQAPPPPPPPAARP